MELGSDGSAACGGRSDRSEWQRSIKSRTSESPKILSGTATGRRIGFRCCHPTRNQQRKRISGCGGIGRLIGFRFQRASVQVRVLSSAPSKREGHQPLSFASCGEDSNQSNATVRWTVARDGLTERILRFHRVLSSAPAKSTPVGVLLICQRCVGCLSSFLYI